MMIQRSPPLPRSKVEEKHRTYQDIPSKMAKPGINTGNRELNLTFKDAQNHRYGIYQLNAPQ
jgi:hypothetical protein